jgi:hypothetical protein
MGPVTECCLVKIEETEGIIDQPVCVLGCAHPLSQRHLPRSINGPNINPRNDKTANNPVNDKFIPGVQA